MLGWIGMKPREKVSLELCGEHLQALFRALERGDVDLVYQLEHELTPEEECVACAYALRAHGRVREVLDTFLQKEGFMVATPLHLNLVQEVWYWVLRIGILTGFIVIASKVGIFFKAAILESRSGVELGSFGMVGALMVGIALFVMIDSWLLEN